MSELLASRRPQVWREGPARALERAEDGGSLLATWTDGGGGALHPAASARPTLRVYNFTRGLRHSFFVLASLGIETYVQKDPAPRRSRTDFFGGVLALRLASGRAVRRWPHLHFGGRRPKCADVYLFAVASSSSSATHPSRAMLQARGTSTGSRSSTCSPSCSGRASRRAHQPRRAARSGGPLPGGSDQGGRSFSLAAPLSLRLRIDLAPPARHRLQLPFFVTTLSTTLSASSTTRCSASSPTIARWAGSASPRTSRSSLADEPLVGSVLLASLPVARGRRGAGPRHAALAGSHPHVAIPEPRARPGRPTSGCASWVARLRARGALAPHSRRSSSSPTWHALRQLLYIGESRGA